MNSAEDRRSTHSSAMEAALNLLVRYGARAPEEAELRAAELADREDDEGAAIWLEAAMLARDILFQEQARAGQRAPGELDG